MPPIHKRSGRCRTSASGTGKYEYGMGGSKKAIMTGFGEEFDAQAGESGRKC